MYEYLKSETLLTKGQQKQESRPSKEEKEDAKYIRYKTRLAKAMNIQLKNAHKINIKEAEDIYGIMQQILKREHKVDRTKEYFWPLA